MEALRYIPTVNRLALCAAAVVTFLFTGCAATAPLVARHSPYAQTETASAEDTQTLKRDWDQWAQSNLQSGDVLFGKGDARAFFGLFRFSQVTSKMAASRFSHTGLISCENGDVYVYDMAPQGARRMRFADYVLEDDVVNLAIKRPAPRYRHLAPKAVEFCQKIYQEQPKFDRQFCLDDDRLYCTELTAMAYHSAGLDLCEPIRLDELPNYHDFPFLTRLAQVISPLRPDTRVFIPGNDRQGLWSCPHLELIYENFYSPDDEQRYVRGTAAATASHPKVAATDAVGADIALREKSEGSIRLATHGKPL